MTEAIKKTVKIHTRLPPGGILVFLTGQNEIMSVCKKLEERFGPKALKKGKTNSSSKFEDGAQATATVRAAQGWVFIGYFFIV